jgi:hypothetical protein
MGDFWGTAGLANGTLTPLLFSSDWGGPSQTMVVPSGPTGQVGITRGVPLTAHSVIFTVESLSAALAGVATPVDSGVMQGSPPIFVTASPVPGPASFWLWSFNVNAVRCWGSDNCDAGSAYLWALPYAAGFVNMTTASVVWVAGQAVMPGAVAAVWCPALQEAQPGDVLTGVPAGLQCVTAQNWGVHVCSPSSGPSWTATTIALPGGQTFPDPQTMPNQSTVRVRCAPRQKAANAPGLDQPIADEMAAAPLPSYPYWYWYDTTASLRSLSLPYPVPPVYVFTDPYNPAPGGDATKTIWASVLQDPPKGTPFANQTPALCILNATPYNVQVTYPAYTATGGPSGGPGAVMTTSPTIPPALPISTTGQSGVFCGTLCTAGAQVWATIQVLDKTTGAVVDTVQYSYSSSATEPSATFGLKPVDAPMPMLDCWPFGSPPPPQVDVGVNGVAFTATNAWARPPNATDAAQQPVYPQWPNPANVNITVRTAPLLKLLAMGNPGAVKPPGYAGLPAASAYLGSTPFGLPPSGDAMEYLGGFNTGVSIVPQGMAATLSPASMDDVLIVEMPVTQDTMQALGCPTAASGNYVPSAFFTTLTLADLQAARTGPSLNAFSLLTAPVSLTPYLTMVADDGESVLIMVGPNQPVTGVSAGGGQVTDLAPAVCLPPAQVCPSAAQFVSEVCASPGFSLCRTVVGTQPQSCLGYFSTTKSAGGVFQGASTLAEACQQTCALDQDASTGTACRTLALTHCTGPAATALPECACVRMQDSTAPVNVLAGSPTTFPQFQEWFQTNFKGGGLPQLLQNVQCWWPACNGPDAGLTYFTPCPEVITECFALVSKVTATNDSKVNIDLRNACGVSQQPSTATTGVGGSAGGPPPPIPAKKNIVPIVLAAVITLLIVIIIIAAWAAAGKVLRSRTLTLTLGGAGGGGAGGSR